MSPHSTFLAYNVAALPPNYGSPLAGNAGGRPLVYYAKIDFKDQKELIAIGTVSSASADSQTLEMVHFSHHKGVDGKDEHYYETDAIDCLHPRKPQKVHGIMVCLG